MARSSNRVRELRERLGLSQVELAAAVGLSRQTIGLIEAGRTAPSVDVALRLSKALDGTVDTLFGDAGTEPLRAEPFSSRCDGRVAVAQIGGRWIAFPLAGDGLGSAADGISVLLVGGAVEVSELRPTPDLRENVVLAGCAPALGILASRLNARPGPGHFRWIDLSSTRALRALVSGRSHLAGVHLVDERSGSSNVVDVRSHAGPAPLVMVTLARWEAGLVVARGNPKRIRRTSDLLRRGVRLVARERGSGARRLLDKELATSALRRPRCELRRSRFRATVDVARAVALGAGDAGVATMDAARAFDLTFVPLAEERYDVVLPESLLSDPRFRRLFDVMSSGEFRREISSLGYDVSATGARVADIRVRDMADVRK
ncbi:MAG: helix-turn-helix domain-containing protein [Myxococcales bacterium]|nr:helix-turn-helix domain-containing protein [Myxococcales bacterium]